MPRVVWAKSPSPRSLHATRPDLISSIREQGGQPSGGRAAARWRTALATAQIGLALALLASAGLFTRSLANISRLDLGVKVDSVITFGVSPELNGYAPGRSHQFFQRLEDGRWQAVEPVLKDPETIYR